MKTVKIVIEETGVNTPEGKGFQVYLEGDIANIQLGVDDDLLSPAEFWGKKLFGICGAVLQETGALKSVTARRDRGN